MPHCKASQISELCINLTRVSKGERISKMSTAGEEEAFRGGISGVRAAS